jgi:hypothetical protein
MQRLLPFLVLTSIAPPDKLDDKRSKDLVLVLISNHKNDIMR